LQAGPLFLATIALLVPSAIAEADSTTGAAFTNKLSVGLAVLLIAAYGLGMLFSLKTHREFFGSVADGEEGEEPWPIGLALATLAGVTVLVALVSEIFVESVQEAAVAFGMTPAFVGFIVVAPVLVLLSYVIGPAPMDLRFWPGAVVMMLIATLTASLVTNSGRSAWFVGVLVLMVYLIFALTLFRPDALFAATPCPLTVSYGRAPAG
jgi:Ca2+:H+ antiporter